jgi:transposase-like protein
MRGTQWNYALFQPTGATIDFLLLAKRDAPAGRVFSRQGLGGENHPAPRVINTDEHAIHVGVAT